MAYYVMEEMPDIHKKGTRILYPKLTGLVQISTKELVERIAGKSTFSKGEIVGILQLLGESMSEMMAKGCSVKLEGIGNFTPSLKLCKGKKREEADEKSIHRNARSIEIGNVNFRPDSEWVKSIDIKCNLERYPEKRVYSSQQYTPEERRNIANEYLKTHPFLTVKIYQELTGLLHTAAANELKLLASIPESGIGIAGKGVHRIYIKK